MPKILVMDDDPSVRELCAIILAGEGYSVVEAPDALTGIRAAQLEKPDLILLDWMMPHIDGLDALRRLKAHSETAAIPVVMLTALDGLADVGLATMGGAESYVTKPFEPAQLASLVRRYLDHSAA